MPRIIRARDQAELAAAFLRVAAPPLATPPVGAPEVAVDPRDPRGHFRQSPVDYDTARDNIVSHVKGATRDQHFKGRVWYRGGHELFRDVGALLKGDPLHNLDRAITTASAFSPQTAWGDNIQHAIHFLLHYDGKYEKRHDWQTAVVHPKALARFREQYKRDPGLHPELDIQRLAKAHRLSPYSKRSIPGFEGLRPGTAEYAEWADNIRTRGWDSVLARHNRQVKQSGTTPARDENGNKIPRLDPETGEPMRNAAGKPMFLQVKKVYDPNTTMAHTGIPTFGGSIKKAKDVFNNVGSAVAELLGSRKTRAFYTNLRDESPLREARTYAQAHQDVMDYNHDRPGFREEHSPYFQQARDPKLAHQKMEDDEGYYEMPVNPETGKRDWTLHSDQRATVDTQHSRAITMRHGDWRKTDYDQPAALAHDDGYDAYERNIQDATKAINDDELDPGKHLLPKQVQAIVWGKHKDDNEHFDKVLGLTSQGDAEFYPPTPKEPGMKGKIDEPIPNYTEDWHNMPYSVQDKRKPAPNFQDAPNLSQPMPEDFSLDAMRERNMSPLERRSMWVRMAATLREHLHTGEPFDWDDHLNEWIDRRFPHRRRLRELRASYDVLSWADQVLKTSNHFLTASGYYDPERERQEYMEHQKWLEENAEGLNSEDFSMTGHFPINPENFGRSVRDRLTRSSRRKAKQED